MPSALRPAAALPELGALQSWVVILLDVGKSPQAPHHYIDEVVNVINEIALAKPGNYPKCRFDCGPSEFTSIATRHHLAREGVKKAVYVVEVVSATIPRKSKSLIDDVLRESGSCIHCGPPV